ncbi:response regulator transcription factor [Paenibacillus sp. HN-1]|uniref:response regulator n=1 Tax=Paenibacillus TaxID=44249 RepID=UPI001CA95225|nr:MULTISPECIES: response regulator transcription factor [Paenibacillus]MBY9080312.1 response regulator transcription factor [Paenibacillus sp. CGMCC 1.18879]MBY9083029.1 response regulator transcription factor [Paenibacillus sinensis]
MVNIIIVDDQQIVREGLKMILSLHDEVKVVGEASNGEEALELLAYTSPEVVLMDIKMPVMNGIDATKLVKAKYPEIKVIILTTFNDREYIFTGLKNGADGYILKDSGSREIMDSIRTACEGNILLNPKITREVVNALNIVNYAGSESLPNEQILELLTPRELEVAKCIMKGKSNKEISTELFITEGTVKNYVSRMLEKLELKNRTELTLCLQKSL